MHRPLEPSRRSLLKICNKYQDTSPPRKSRRTTCCCGTDSSKNSPPQKKVGRKVKKNLLHEFSENESSKGNIKENKKFINFIPRKVSTDSVIYMGTIKSKDINSNDVVDLTNSSDSLSPNEKNVYSKSLKTIYFPSKNFDRNITLRKNLVTTSLINLPVIRKPIPQQRLYSATQNNKTKHQKLNVLNLPEQYLNCSDFFCEENVLSTSALTESDQKIIDWILEQEVINNRSAFNDLSSLDTGFDSVQELCKGYEVESDNNFD